MSSRLVAGHLAELRGCVLRLFSRSDFKSLSLKRAHVPKEVKGWPTLSRLPGFTMDMPYLACGKCNLIRPGVIAFCHVAGTQELPSLTAIRSKGYITKPILVQALPSQNTFRSKCYHLKKHSEPRAEGTHP